MCPLYDYRCEQCGRFEHWHGINEKLEECPHCKDGSKVKKELSSVGFFFKGDNNAVPQPPKKNK